MRLVNAIANKKGLDNPLEFFFFVSVRWGDGVMDAIVGREVVRRVVHAGYGVLLQME